MGWIAALKQGSPSAGSIETLLVKDGGRADGSKAVTLVDGTGGSGTMTVTMGAPSSNVTDGFVKTIIRIDETAQIVGVLPDAALRGDEPTADAISFPSGVKGGVARYIWAGEKWYAIPGVTAAADLDITVG